MRRPDISFFRSGRLAAGQTWAKGYEQIVPDLAVEVLSPNDLIYEVDAKIEEYLTVGVQLIWVINPATRTVKIYRPDGTLALLREEERLDGEEILPGFTCSVAEIFEATPT